MTKEGSEPGETTANTRRRSAFSGIEQRVLKRLRALHFGARPKIVVGFSGGPDSLCLAAILARLSRNGHVQPLLVHVNHHLRPGSDHDAGRALALASQLDLPIKISGIEGDLAENYAGVGIEEAARRGRYLLLARAAIELGTRTIAIAHHQDDQAETVLLHLLRGSGLKGVAGMAESTSSAIPWWTADREFGTDFAIWRPLLLEPKTEIEAYVANLGLTPIVDESNSDSKFRRNAIRHTVLPAIDEVFPAARSALARFARIAREEDGFLDELAREAATRAVSTDGRLSRSQLRSERMPIRRRMVVIWLDRWVSSEAITLDRIDAVLELAELNRPGKVIEVGENVSVEMVGDELVVRGGLREPQGLNAQGAPGLSSRSISDANQ